MTAKRPINWAPRAVFWFQLVSLFVLYFVAASVGLKIHAVSGFASLVWPPTGIALAFIVLFGQRLWPAVALGALLVNWMSGAPAPGAAGVAIGNTLEALVGAWLLRNVINFDPSLRRTKDVVGLFLFCTPVSSLVSATIGVLSLAITSAVPPENLFLAWRMWWVGDVLGAIVVTPLLLTWMTSSRPVYRAWRFAELVAYSAFLVFVCLSVFGDLSGVTGVRIPPYPFTLFPFIVWAALRFGQTGTATTTFVACGIGIWSATRGHVPFAQASFSEGLMLLNSFIAIYATTGMVLAANLSERRTREEALKRSEELNASILQGSLDCIIALDPLGRIKEFNPASERTFGYKRDEVIDREMSEFLVPARFREAYRNGFANLVNSSGRILQKHIELIGLHRNGAEIPFELSVTPAEVAGTTLHYGFLRDIADRKRAAEELLAAKEAAEEANVAKSAFLANMSHEIRTPLGAVMGFSDLVADAQIRPSEKANYVAAIRRNGELLSNIINDILDLSKVEAGKMEVHVREAALTEILTDAQTLLRLQALEKGISFTVSVDENVPAIIVTDPLRLRQVLINIIGNAIKFTAKGEVSVLVSLNRETGLLQFEVKDSGQGVERDQVAKLFLPFSQAESGSRRKHGGTGLGLALSKRLANLLGGDVVLSKTQVEKGSTFVVTINPGPAKAHFASSEEALSHHPITNLAQRLDGVNVLLADDAPDNQVLVSRVLRLAGATVDLATNGKEALEMAKRKPYDVLLMDLQMPVMDGYEATSELRHHGYRGKILALTAHALNDERERCLRSGFDDHLSKPVNRQQLIERVGRHCRQSSV